MSCIESLIESSVFISQFDNGTSDNDSSDEDGLCECTRDSFREIISRFREII